MESAVFPASSTIDDPIDDVLMMSEALLDERTEIGFVFDE
jgi:hypothetical protein